jgi:DNA-binding IclR family transcriptional regulator
MTGTTDTMDQPDALSGVERVVATLRLVATAPAGGLRSAEVSRALDLRKATTSRLLASLEATGVLYRDAGRRWHVTEAFRASFGLPLASARLRQAARPALGALSDSLCDTTFLSVRAGLDSLCLERHVGSYPLQALSLSVGSRRPLGIGAGSMALLAWLPEAERQESIAAQAGRLAHYPQIDLATLSARAEEARARGHVVLRDFVVRGMTGIARPVRDGAGLVIGALSVAALTERLSGPREAMAIAALDAAVAQTERHLASPEVTGQDIAPG